MEQQRSKSEAETDKINKLNSDFGFNRYNFLKTLEEEDLTEHEKSQMKIFEEIHFQSEEQKENLRKYHDFVRSDNQRIEKEFTKKELWSLFLKTFKEMHGKDFIYNDEILENIKPIMYYFLKDDNFFFCKNLTDLSEPSFDKGLLIIGNFGNGKTSTMLVFEKIFKGIKSKTFKSYSTNEVVNLFEKINPASNDQIITRVEFDKMMNTGVRYFDDVKTERPASNFGKMNLMKDILEVREKNNLKTHITCNFKDGFEN